MIRALLAFTLVACTVAFAAPPVPGDLGSLWQRQHFTAGRASSADPTGGNGDCKWIAPGDSLTLADIDGPGMIHHIWSTVWHPDPDHLRKLVLRVYWDGETNPSVEAPLGDFFGLGHGQVYGIDSAPVQIGSYKGMNCFWSMPFRKHARVTLENQSDQPCGAFYYYIDYRTGIDLPADTAYFHARYHQAFPADPVHDYVILEATGAGHYVGCNMSIQMNTGGWWGEGDDKIMIDDATSPTLAGTGSEDYFGGAWCYHEPFSRDYLGAPLILGPHPGHDSRGRMPGALWNVYRYHVADPIPFTRNIKVHIETGLHPGDNSRSPFTNHHSSVAYWYQVEPHAPFAALPRERVSHQLIAMIDPAAATKEAEAMALTAFSPGTFDVDYQLRNWGEEGIWSGDFHAWMMFNEPGQWVDFEFPVAEAGSYRVSAILTRKPDYGIAELSVNGELMKGGIDAYLDKVDQIVVPLGNVMLKSGANTLRVKGTGKCPASAGLGLGLDALLVTPAGD